MELTPFFFGLYKFVKYGLYPLTWVLTGGNARGFGTGPKTRSQRWPAWQSIGWRESSSLRSR